MTPEQARRLSAIQDRLLDAYEREIDPDRWPGGHKTPAEMTRDERGDAYWVRKLAASTLALFHRGEMMLDRAVETKARLAVLGRKGGMMAGDDDGTVADALASVDLDKDIRRYEGEAKRFLDKIAGA